MPKTKISEFSSTPANNTDIDSIFIGEGMAPSNVNDAIRELMAQLKDWQSGTSNDPYVVGSSGSLTLNQGTANTVPYLNGSKVVTSGTALSFDGSNLGLGVTPSAWSAYKAMQFAAQGVSVFGNTSISQAGIGSNGYYNGTNWIYNNSSTAAQYLIDGANHKWYTAASGTAGNAITFTQAMTLDASGNLLVGTTSQISNEKLSVVTGNTTGMVVKTTGGATYVPIYSWNATTTGDGYFAGFFTEASATFRGSISYNRTAGLVAYNTTSDYRAKDISGPVTGSGALIDSTPVYMGKMKGATQERPMFIAHETPSYVHTGEKDAVDADGNPVYQQMDASALIPVMWAEIQSLRKRLADAGL